MKEQEQKTIEQLERISSMLGIIGETEDYTDVAINALEDMQQYRILENRLSRCPCLFLSCVTAGAR